MSSSPTVRQVLSAQYAEERRAAARRSERAASPRSPHAVMHPLAALRARRAGAAARPAATGAATC